MTEKKSDIALAVGMLMVMIPGATLIWGGLLTGFISFMVGVTAMVALVCGAYTAAYAHEHAKALPQCGTIHAQRIEN